ncbi:hypothetical protein EDC01DRAFT_634538 [Geopyxis carbonaria]|nr:hypothetical protein EDC01DRAFT_634538 [Geopyxis carbonaria]
MANLPPPDPNGTGDSAIPPAAPTRVVTKRPKVFTFSPTRPLGAKPAPGMTFKTQQEQQQDQEQAESQKLQDVDEKQASVVNPTQRAAESSSDLPAETPLPAEDMPSSQSHSDQINATPEKNVPFYIHAGSAMSQPPLPTSSDTTKPPLPTNPVNRPLQQGSAHHTHIPPQEMEEALAQYQTIMAAITRNAGGASESGARAIQDSIKLAEVQGSTQMLARSAEIPSTKKLPDSRLGLVPLPSVMSRDGTSSVQSPATNGRDSTQNQPKSEEKLRFAQQVNGEFGIDVVDLVLQNLHAMAARQTPAQPHKSGISQGFDHKKPNGQQSLGRTVSTCMVLSSDTEASDIQPGPDEAILRALDIDTPDEPGTPPKNGCINPAFLLKRPPTPIPATPIPAIKEAAQPRSRSVSAAQTPATSSNSKGLPVYKSQFDYINDTLSQHMHPSFTHYPLLSVTKKRSAPAQPAASPRKRQKKENDPDLVELELYTPETPTKLQRKKWRRRNQRDAHGGKFAPGSEAAERAHEISQSSGAYTCLGLEQAGQWSDLTLNGKS